MPITFVSLTQDERDLLAAEAIHVREIEAHCYGANVAQYEALLASAEIAALPAIWPAALAGFQGSSRDAVIASNLSAESRDLVLALQHRDRLRMLLACEKHELGKVEKYHDEAVKAIPSARLAAAILAARAKRAR